MATIMNAPPAQMNPPPSSKEMVVAAAIAAPVGSVASMILRNHHQQQQHHHHHDHSAEHLKTRHACAIMGMALRMKPFSSTALEATEASADEKDHPFDEDFLMRRPAVLGALPREPYHALDDDNESHCSSDVTDTEIDQVLHDSMDDYDNEDDDHSDSSDSSVHSDCVTVKQGNRLVQECSNVKTNNNNNNNKISRSVSKDESEGEQSDDTATTEEEEDDGEVSTSSDGSMDMAQLENHDQLALRERKNSWFQSWWKESLSQEECSHEEDHILKAAVVAVNPACNESEGELSHDTATTEEDEDVSSSASDGSMDMADLENLEGLAMRERTNSWFHSWWEESSSPQEGHCASDEEDDIMTDLGQSFENSTLSREQDWSAQLSDIEKELDDVLESQTQASNENNNLDHLFDADFDTIATIPEYTNDEEDATIEIVSSEEDLFGNIKDSMDAPVETAPGKSLVASEKTKSRRSASAKRVSFDLARNSTFNLEPVIITGDVIAVEQEQQSSITMQKWKQLRQWKQRRQIKATAAASASGSTSGKQLSGYSFEEAIAAAAAAAANNNWKKNMSISSTRSVSRRAKNDDKSIVDDDFSSRNMTLLRRFRATHSAHKLLND